MANTNLIAAQKAKNDEFYTMMEDIEKELVYYKKHFKGKTVYCNCDTEESNFVRYFVGRFEELGLKKLIATHWNDGGAPSYKAEWANESDEPIRTALSGDGDFRSPECIELLKEADVVVTNPPFSLFREYVAQLMEYGKKFVIIGNMNCITYKEIFPLIKDNRLWAGANEKGGSRKGNSLSFEVSDGYEGRTVIENGRRVAQISAWWFTNLDIRKRHEPLDLIESYSPDKYPKYDNYDAINVDKTLDIPADYDGAMGVPISFLDKYCPEQFEIVGFRKGEDGKDLVFTRDEKKIQPYFRILIRRK